MSGFRLLDFEPATTPSLTIPALAGTFPPAHALRGPRGIVNQREVPCCVSCAFATAMESLQPGFAQLAPLFHYYFTRTARLMLPAGQMAELSLAEAAQTLALEGICVHELHEHSSTLEGASQPPVPAAVADGRARRLPFNAALGVPRFRRLSDQFREMEWKKALLTGKPIVAGFSLVDGYGAPMRRLDLPASRTGTGHAVAILGYRDSERAFIVQDSRGEDFGLGGQWWMSYSFAASAFVQEAYCIGPRP